MNAQISGLDIANSISAGHRREEKDHSCLQRNLYKDPLLSYSNGTVIGKIIEPNVYFMSSIVEDGEGSSFSTHKSQDQVAAPSLSVTDKLYSEHMKAKAEHVESTVQGMSSSFNKEERILSSHIKAAEQLTGLEREGCRENKKKRKILHQQSHCSAVQMTAARESRTERRRRQLTEQHWVLERQLKHLQERLFQVRYLRNVEERKLKYSANRRVSDGLNESYLSDFVWKRVSGMEAQTRLEEERAPSDNNDLSPQEKRLSEMLKQELSSAVTQIVDSVVKKVLLKHSGHFAWMTQMLRPNMTELSPAVEFFQKEKSNRPGHGKASQKSINETETQALSYIVGKSCDTSSEVMDPREINKSYQVPYLMALKGSVQENKIVRHLLGPRQNPSSISPNSTNVGSAETMERDWENLKMMSPVSARYPLCAPQEECPSMKAGCSDLLSTVDEMHYTSAHVSFTERYTQDRISTDWECAPTSHGLISLSLDSKTIQAHSSLPVLK